jgi:PAS domain S-box-containing protein
LRINYNRTRNEAESEETVLMTFGQRLRELRNQQGLTQKELADKAGVSITYVSKLETGALPPPREKAILALASILDADQAELFGLAKKLPSRWLGQMNPAVARTFRSILEAEKPSRVARAVPSEGMPHQTPSELEPAQPDVTLSQQENRFGAIVENSADGIMIMNEDLDVIYENPASARILGYEPGKMAGRDPLKIVHVDDMEKLGKGFADLLKNPGGAARETARVRHRDGTWRLIEAVGVNLVHDPAVKGIVMNFRDVTGRADEEEERSRNAAVLATAKRCGLTKSEEEVLALMVEGKSNLQIGEQLVTSGSTVKFHVGNILSKLGVTNRIEAVALVLRHRPSA